MKYTICMSDYERELIAEILKNHSGNRFGQAYEAFIRGSIDNTQDDVADAIIKERNERYGK